MKYWATVVVLAASLALPSSCAATVLVRTDQLGYPAGGAATVFVMSSSDLEGTAVVVRGPLGERVRLLRLAGAGSAWSKRYRYVYKVALGRLQRSGTYVVQVQPELAHGDFSVDGPAALYSPALERALRFYGNERDGPEFIPSALRSAPGHLNDSHAEVYATPRVNGNGEFAGELTPLGETIDASGGWWDAGDYLKFVQTASYTVDVMLAAESTFPALVGPGGANSSFAAESEFGLRWLAKMWNAKTATLYYQVGIGSGNEATYSDHDVWRLPQEDETFGGEAPLYRYIRARPVFRAGPPGARISPNLAGRLAAAFAGGYLIMRGSDPALAQTYLADAEQVYSLANTSPRGRLLTTIPWNFYPEREWRDDMLLGASVLARALESDPSPIGLRVRSPQPYVNDAGHWLSAYDEESGSGAELNLYDTSALGEFEYVRALRGYPGPTGALQKEALAALREKLTAAEKIAAGDPFGLGTPWSASDTVSRADGLSATASMYDALTRRRTFAPDALNWIGASLGANAWGSSFIVGDGTLFPHCLQHQVANLVGSLDGSAPVLEGAVVEGPSNERSSGEVAGMRPCPAGGGNPFAQFDGSGSKYEDNVQAYTNTEPTIDLTASSVLAFAFLSGEVPEVGA